MVPGPLLHSLEQETGPGEAEVDHFLLLLRQLLPRRPLLEVDLQEPVIDQPDVPGPRGSPPESQGLLPFPDHLLVSVLLVPIRHHPQPLFEFSPYLLRVPPHLLPKEILRLETAHSPRPGAPVSSATPSSLQYLLQRIPLVRPPHSGSNRLDAAEKTGHLVPRYSPFGSAPPSVSPSSSIVRWTGPPPAVSLLLSALLRLRAFRSFSLRLRRRLLRGGIRRALLVLLVRRPLVLLVFGDGFDHSPDQYTLLLPPILLVVPVLLVVDNTNGIEFGTPQGR